MSSGMMAVACVVGLAVLTLVLYPTVQKQKAAADRTRALSNLRQIGLSLSEFDAQFGSFPNAETAHAVKAYSKTPLPWWGKALDLKWRELLR